MSNDFVCPDIEHMTTAQMLTGTATLLYHIHDYTDADKARAAAQRGRGGFDYAAQPMTAQNLPSHRLPREHQEPLGADFDASCEAVQKELMREGKWERPAPERKTRKRKGKGKIFKLVQQMKRGAK